MPPVDMIIYVLLLLSAALSYFIKKLTLAGALTGAAVAVLIYKGAGLTGVALLASFFVAGSLATAWKRDKKSVANAAENLYGRTSGQVLANGGVAALLGALAFYYPQLAPLFQVMIAGSFAAATADTLSSELGMVYGRRFYNVVSWKKDTRGLDGVVSVEGTLIGAFGAMVIATLFSFGFGWSIYFWWIILAGVIGNLSDSILGATLERDGRINNNTVNLLNTGIGAGICWVLDVI